MASVGALSRADLARIRERLRRGDFQHDIAADYGLNQGRISEINTGRRFEEPPKHQPDLF